jgi:hypothetical protein
MIQNNNSQSEFTAYIKLARTANVFTLIIDSSISVKNFIEIIKNSAFDNFNINRQEYDIEVVVSGQYEYGAPEDAPAILPSDDTMQYVFGKALAYNAYYIRIIRLPESLVVPDIPQPYPMELLDILNFDNQVTNQQTINAQTVDDQTVDNDEHTDDDYTEINQTYDDRTDDDQTIEYNNS